MDSVPVVTRKRIALIIPTLDRSGAEKQFTLLATRLPRDRFDVRVLLLTRAGPYLEELQQADIPVTCLEKRSKLDLAAFRRLRGWLRDVQPDVIHTWLFAANAYGRLAAGSAPQAKIVVSERCVDTWKTGWQLWLDRRLAGRTDRLVGNSQSVVEFYRQLGVPAEKLVCIPNGISCDAPTAIDRQAALRELGWPEETIVAGYVGRLASQKRVEDLIFAVEVVRHSHPMVRLLLVGDGPERTRLETFSRDVGCAGHVCFLGRRDDRGRWLALFDVFCLASSFEGMSNSLMEALAGGHAVVASDIPPNRELITQGESGFLAPVGDRVAIMQFLKRLIDDAGLRRRLGMAGRQHMQTRFRIEGMVQRYAELYDQLIGQGTSG